MKLEVRGWNSKIVIHLTGINYPSKARVKKIPIVPKKLIGESMYYFCHYHISIHYLKQNSSDRWRKFKVIKVNVYSNS